MLRTSVSRLVFLLQSVSLAGLLGVLALVSSYAWSQSREAEHIVSATRTDQALFNAMIDVRQQIAQVLTAIISEDHPADTISDRQAVAHEAFAEMMASLADAPVGATLVNELVAARQNMIVQEALIDREASLPRALRNLDQVKAWSRSVLELVQALNSASLAVGNEVRPHDSFVSEMLQIRNLAWQVRHRFGGLCSLLRRSVDSSAPLSAETAARWNRRVGGYTAGWHAIDTLLDSPGAPPRVVAAATEARAATEEVQAKLEALIDGFENGGVAFMPAQEFTRFCNSPFDQITAVAFLAMAEAVSFAERRKQRADIVLAISVFGCLLAAGIAALTLRTILYRFSRPIQELMGAVAASSVRDQDRPVPTMPYPDEFGRLALALEEHKKTQRDLIQTEKMAALGRMVAGVAHEVNTPIGSSLIAATALVSKLNGFNRLMAAGPVRRSDFTELIGTLKEGVQMITANTRRAHELIQSFKQVAVDQTSSTRRVFDLDRMLREMEMALRPQLKRSPHKLVIDVPGILTLDSYPGPLQQVLTNLVVNALTHAFDETRCGTIRIIAEPTSDGLLQILVSDDGKGIADEHISRIFDPFFTTKLGQGGTGLGLNISYGIVTSLLGGAISVHSTPESGTTFTIEIPISAPRADETAARKPDSRAAHQEAKPAGTAV